MTKQFLVPLLLPADPTAPLEAATKQYVDASTGGGTALVWQTEAPTDTAVLWADTDEPAGATRIVTHPETTLTAALTDAEAYLRFTGTNPVFTFPLNVTVAFPVGTRMEGVGTTTPMTLAYEAGVQLNRARGLVTTVAGSAWSAIKVATDEWDVHGDLT